jgi:hypothetical protein
MRECRRGQLNERRFAEVLRAAPILEVEVDLQALHQTRRSGRTSLTQLSLVTVLEGGFNVCVDGKDFATLTSYQAIRRHLEERGM